MGTTWQTLEISQQQIAAAAELVLLAGPDLVSHGSERSAMRALRAAQQIGFSAEPGQTLDLLADSGSSPRVLALGIGSHVSTDESHWLSIGGFLVEAMTRHRVATIRVPQHAALGGAHVLESILLGVLLHAFRLRKSTGGDQKRFVPVGLLVAADDAAIAERARRCADAVNRARAWVEQPPNALTPPLWAEEIREAFTDRGASVRMLGPDELRALGAGALLAVGSGSQHGAYLVAVEWRGDCSRDSWDAALVGKGLTFDSGGLNLKAAPNIAKMKLDMAAGAGVLGALELCIQRRSRANVVAVVPIAENSIDALAYRPGDVVTTLAGLTIEVADTDAEGRLALADAITFAIRNYRARRIVDGATLTTAVTSVLHEEFAGLYASNDQLAEQLIAAGEAVGERLWRLPLDASQDYLIESEIADMCNVGPPGLFGRGTGSPAAGAKLLQRFAEGTPWAHVDMAGTAWATRRTARGGKGATGYGVRLLDRWLAALEAGASS